MNESAQQSLNHVARVVERGLTVGDLIQELKTFDRDAQVVFTCNYGDYANTQQALPVESIDELDWDSQWLSKSGYSHSGIALESLDVCDDDEDSPTADEALDMVGSVVVLSFGN